MDGIAVLSFERFTTSRNLITSFGRWKHISMKKSMPNFENKKSHQFLCTSYCSLGSIINSIAKRTQIIILMSKYDSKKLKRKTRQIKYILGISSFFDSTVYVDLPYKID